MTFDNQKKKKKKEKSIMEKELMALIQAALRSCLQQAINDVMKELNI